MSKRSSNSEKHPYTRGFSFWSNNTFWRTAYYSEKEQRRFDMWLEELRTNEKQLTKLG